MDCFLCLWLQSLLLVLPDSVVRHSESNHVNNLADFESVNIPCQEYEFLTAITDKLKWVKVKNDF